MRYSQWRQYREEVQKRNKEGEDIQGADTEGEDIYKEGADIEGEEMPRSGTRRYSQCYHLGSRQV